MGPLSPEVVQSTDHHIENPGSSVLILGEQDGRLDNGKNNYWLPQVGQTNGQGFTVRVDTCARMIAGVQIKNARNAHEYATNEFKVSASLNKKGPWETVVDSRLPDTRKEAATLLNFTFEQPVELKYLKFELISYWARGGGLQYFAPILATSEYN